ncbi:hypothetical protein IEO21_09898 [Rhodonia placenta]|uniref:Uncharacterized protein n=1 Tax=Rhodonia placenta TaxID=104341 RepID=A0A8H7NTF4_9APHY|nr:hypothetical protein IEO21_09898 [Postia placenta]
MRRHAGYGCLGFHPGCDKRPRCFTLGKYKYRSSKYRAGRLDGTGEVDARRIGALSGAQGGVFLIRSALRAACVGPRNNNLYNVLATANVYELDHGSQHFHIPVHLKGKRRHKDIIAMVDSGATTKFINK